MQTRIYVVSSTKEPKTPRLVRATSKYQAVQYIAQDEYHCMVAKTDDVAELIQKQGVQVEDAANKPVPPTEAVSEQAVG